MYLLILRQSEWKEQLWFPKQQLPECLNVAIPAAISQACFLQGKKCPIVFPIIGRITLSFFPKMENGGSSHMLLLTCVDM